MVERVVCLQLLSLFRVFFGPVIAAILISSIGLSGIMVLAIFTFILAISTLLFVEIPQPSGIETGHKGIKNIWKGLVESVEWLAVLF